MKKVLIPLVLLLVIGAGLMVWLASSVGPDTAPQEVKSIELPSDYDR